MIRFLQISDIHFTDTSENDDEYKLMKRRFLEDIAECCSLPKGSIDHILICGDIAFSGMESQYKKAKEFIETICEKARCSVTNVFVVPGNHDKKREVYVRTRQIMKDTLLKGKNAKQLLESKVKEPMAIGILYAPFKQYYKFASGFNCISDVALKAACFPESDQRMRSISRFKPNDVIYWSEQLRDLHKYAVHIHGSNTSLLSDKDDGESWDLKEGEHLQVLPLQAYNVAGKSNEIHILMLHHPMSEIENGKSIGKELDTRFLLQFYGHIHKQSSSSERAIKIYSGALQPPEGDGNQYFPVYNIIEIDVVEEAKKPFLKVEVFSRRWDGANFIEYVEETKTGKKALKLELKHNEAWRRTMERINNEEHVTEGLAIVKPDVNPHAVKNGFLRCGREGKIISKMYGEKFNKISPNRIKYLAFLKQVEQDGRLNELNEILKLYEK